MRKASHPPMCAKKRKKCSWGKKNTPTPQSTADVVQQQQNCANHTHGHKQRERLECLATEDFMTLTHTVVSPLTVALRVSLSLMAMSGVCACVCVSVNVVSECE